MPKRSPKNILVTGGAGFIGSAFIRYLLSADRDFEGFCTNLDALTYAGNLENLKEIESDPRYSFCHGSIGDKALVEKIVTERTIDTIVHFAAESHVDRSISNPTAFLTTNVLGTASLLGVLRNHPSIHFHHISTDEVYGHLGDEGLFTEETPYAPSSPYSASKAASDHLVRAYATTYGLSTCISNCSNNYGPYHFPEKLIPLMILNCLAKQPLPIYGDGKNVRDWLYVDDHAAAIWLLLQRGEKGQTYNIGGNEERTNLELVHELIETLAKALSTDPATFKKLITFITDRPGHDYRYAIDATKIQDELGWRPQHTLKEGLEKTVQWYLGHSDWIEHVKSGTYQEWLTLNYARR